MLNYLFGSAGVLGATTIFSVLNAGLCVELWENISQISNFMN